ncbi:type II toxin-antitoxin system VapB family antitoxin [Deinococcus sp.]|uniref:type II toxin-antitoxin system VapB family antitoxin n=1 Tax=Deinococcus sp. TaxID=47478 RepID=UPI003CC6D84C
MAITVEIDIDDELLAEAEKMAEELEITLSELFNEALRRHIKFLEGEKVQNSLHI